MTRDRNQRPSGHTLTERATSAMGMIALSGFVLVGACAAASISLWEMSDSLRRVHVRARQGQAKWPAATPGPARATSLRRVGRAGSEVRQTFHSGRAGELTPGASVPRSSRRASNLSARLQQGCSGPIAYGRH
jgi:hypothetical protein